jgi:hypothetical protein
MARKELYIVFGRTSVESRQAIMNSPNFSAGDYETVDDIDDRYRYRDQEGDQNSTPAASLIKISIVFGPIPSNSESRFSKV